MSKPIRIDLPHRLGAAEAKRRMQEGIGKLSDHVPGGADVRSRWDGDRMFLDVAAMGQQVTGHIDVEENKVRLELTLPAFLQLFASKIEGALKKRGTTMLEDKRSA